MGIQGISPGSLIIILLIVLVLFGPNRLSKVAEELGLAIKSFKKSLDEND